ncbi:MAG: curli assembly protein CsgF [Paludibacter sp.]|nr:curli assembly protein CsgF [Paludibacter sp.]
MKTNIAFRIIYVVIIMVLVAACEPHIYQPLQTRRVILVPENTAIYKFRDQARQYKASETGASWITTLPQETTTILVPAIEESDWFVPTEYKIIRGTQYKSTDSNNENTLPSLRFAGVIVEDGIILYDTDILTKGAGVRYFGTTPSVLSDEVFKYVNPKHFIETGYTYNQPTEKSATESIEKAVGSLIDKGVKKNSWGLNDQNSISQSYNGHHSDPLTNSSKSLNQQILSQLTRQIVAKQFSKDALNVGTYVMGDYQVVISNQPQNMGTSITITDRRNESTATVSIPDF